ncbi:winged helix-turn-helix domain-containing protein [Microbulbifer bruguierae]|uniref:Winged helix-turn-helix domain-containing protein n=1 Tax=Microbulbifer bruguierae TaxID=3029061 RepID=A0ABY8N9Y6_9GAMM|nr:winged helix-turn-helix domain-containing protein [Microbulbifer bruguierae]WGL15719.1 winged helix-turn-helix domain-containing protein [Microbulbifer bruguierae]
MSNVSEYELGGVRVNLEAQSVCHGEQRLELSQKKYFDVLQCLIEQYPNWVTREQLIELVWAGNHYVGDKAINNAIWHIRKSLAEIDPDVQYIVTKRGHGYRLAVEPVLREAASPEPNAVRSFPANGWGLGAGLLLLTAVLSWLLVWRGGADSSEIQLTPAERLTNYPGSEFAPAVDPSGQWLAFAWARPNQVSDLYIRALAGDGEPRQLTFSEQSEHGPEWAADGKGIYYVERGGVEQDTVQSTCRVKYLELATLARNTISDCIVDLNTHLAVHPSGSTLAVNRSEPGIFNSGIYLIDLKDPSFPARRVSCGDECKYEDRDMAFSSDGTRLAFTRRSDLLSENIYLRDLRSGEERQLTRDESDIKSLSWDNSDRRIVYTSKVAGKRRTRVVDLESGEIGDLELQGASSLSRVPGSNRFVYSAGNTGKFISYLDLGGDLKAAMPLLHANFNQRSAHYSPVHRKLVYCANESGAMELWVSNLDGSEREQLTSLGGEVVTPRWSNRGDRIVFVASDRAEDGNQLLVIDFATRAISKVEPEHHNYSHPTWSPDDRYLFASVSDGGEYFAHRFDLAAGVDETLGDMPVMKLLSVGDGQVLFTSGPEGGLWSAELDPAGLAWKNLRQILSPEVFASLFNWDVYGERVFFQRNFRRNSQRNTGGQSQVMAFDLSSGDTTALALVPRGSLDRLSDFSYVPERDWLLFTQRESYQSDIYQFELRD